MVLGDGECNEGSVWEAAMAAPNLNLDNLYAIIDKNNFQQTGSNKEIMNTESLKDKWSSFGWETKELNGNNIEEIYDYFEKNENLQKPKAIIANTIKGKGVPEMEENYGGWHSKVPNDEEINEINKQIDNYE